MTEISVVWCSAPRLSKLKPLTLEFGFWYRFEMLEDSLINLSVNQEHKVCTVADNRHMVIKITSSRILFFFFLFLFYIRDGHSRMKNTYEGGGGRAFNSFPVIFPSLEGYIILVGSCLRSGVILVSRNCLPEKSIPVLLQKSTVFPEETVRKLCIK